MKVPKSPKPHIISAAMSMQELTAVHTFQPEIRYVVTGGGLLFSAVPSFSPSCAPSPNRGSSKF